MKGIVLAGGSGTRLAPLTRVINKHLLPVYDRSMISYPLAVMREAGIASVTIVTNPQDVGSFETVLGDAAMQGFGELNYVAQRTVGGIADALRCARDQAGPGPYCVMLGDSVFEKAPVEAVSAFANDPRGMMLLLSRQPDPKRFGVARFDGDRLVQIVEKPDAPPSDQVITGLYLFDETVFDRCGALQPSARGELEITDVVNAYITEGAAKWSAVDGWWLDVGTFEDLARASALLSKGKLSR